MKHITIAALALYVGLAVPQARGPSPIRHGPDFGQQIFYAVLEGLYEDGVDNETVDIVLKKDEQGPYRHFVPGCPVCIYVIEAFRHYRARPDFVSFKGDGNTWGKGLSEDERARFASDQLKPRLEALHDLVERWLGRRMDLLRLDVDERKDWRQQLEERSKKGMSILLAERKAGRMQPWGDLPCPSCEGAVEGSGR